MGNKDEKQKEISRITIVAYNDGRVDVTGPINNPTVFFDLMNKAERVVLNLQFNKIMEKANQRIVVPEPRVDIRKLH